MTAGAWDRVVPFAPFPSMTDALLTDVLARSHRWATQGAWRAGLAAGSPYADDSAKEAKATALESFGDVVHRRALMALERRLEST
jgi:hypothetical protein